MADEKETNVQFGGDASGAVRASQEAAEAVKKSVEQMRASLEGLNSKFELIGSGFAKISAIIAGGAALKEFVSEAISADKAALDLGKSLGINSTEASYFKTALNEVGVSQDAVALAGKRITMALAQGGEKFKALGIETKDANGQFRNSRDIMLDVNEKLRGFREGTDRNIEAQKIYGRSYQDLMPLVTKFTDISEDSARKQGKNIEESSKMQEEAKEKAIALNLVVGQESVDAMKKYTAAKREVNEVMEGVNRTIGQALLPKLTRMAEWFASEGPTAVSVMRGVMDAYMTLQDAVAATIGEALGAIRDVVADLGQMIRETFGQGGEPMTAMQFFANVITVIKVAVMTVALGVQSGINVIVGAFRLFMATVKAAGDQLAALLRLDFAGMGKVGEHWRTETLRIIQETVDKGAEIARAGGAKIQDALMQNPTAPKAEHASSTKGGGANSTGAEKTGPSGADAVARARLEAQLAMRKELLAEELRTLEAQHDQELLSDREFYAAKLANQQAAIDAEITAKKAEADAAGKQLGQAQTEQQRNGILAQQVKLLGEVSVLEKQRAALAETNGEELRKAEESYVKKVEAEAISHTKAMRELAIQQTEDQVNAAKEAGQLTEQAQLTAQRDLIRQRYENERTALQAELELAKGHAADTVRIQDQLLQLDAKYNLQLQQNAAKASQSTAKDWTQLFQQMTNGFAGAIQGLVQRTTTFASITRGLLNNLLGMFSQAVATMAVKWAAQQAMQLASTNSTTAAIASMLGIQTATSIADKKAEAAATIPADAAMAAGAAAASVASTPYVGPALAAAAYAETMGMVMAGMTVASARNGFDIPAGVNPVTQLHEKEMVLPAGPADAVREMAAGGGGGHKGPIHLHGSPDDTVKLREVAGLMKKLNKKFAFV